MAAAEYLIPTYTTRPSRAVQHCDIYRVCVDKVNYTCTISTSEDRQVSIAISSLSLKNFPTTSTDDYS